VHPAAFGAGLVLAVAGLLVPPPATAQAPLLMTARGVADTTSAAAPVTRSVVGLGDSVVSGRACDCTPFVQRYAHLTAHLTGVTVAGHNLGVSGLTSEGLLDQLARGTEAAEAVRGADIVTITIGANDLVPARGSYWAGTCQGCFAAAATKVRRNITAALQRIRTLRAGRPTEILVTTYWNVFKEPTASSSAEFREMVERATARAIEAICAAARTGSVACIDLYRPFKGSGDRDPTRYLAADRDHPNAAGHALIAATLARHGWAELAGPA
jgi:lysophospholipase L1-like esterase